MKWLPALFLGAILAFVLPLVFGGQGGFWMTQLDEMGHHPSASQDSPGLLFSIPLFAGLGSGFSAVLQLAQPLSARNA